MKWSQLLKHTEPCDPPARETSEEVAAVSQLVELEGEIFLNIDLFFQGTRKARYFASAKDKKHAAYVNGAWRRCMIDNVARVCMGKEPAKGAEVYYYGKCWRYDTREDRERANEYLGTYDIEQFETQANQLEYERAIRRKQERIDEIMARVPYVPDEAETWIRNEVFPEEYLFLVRKEKRTDYYCTACGAHSWTMRELKHGKLIECPKCGAKVKTCSRRLNVAKREPVVILQTMGEEWIERQFRAECKWDTAGKEVCLYEECRAIIKKGNCWGTLYYGLGIDEDEDRQEWWDKNQVGKRFLKSYLFPGNLDEVLPYGGLENSGLKEIAEKKEKMNINRFIITFHERSWIEYLIKAGLTRLVGEIMDGSMWWGDPGLICTYAKTLQGALQIDGNRLNRMKQLNGGMRVLGWLQYEEYCESEGEKSRITQESLEYLDKKKIGQEECEEILKGLGSVNRMVNYIKKQKDMRPARVIQIWNDYISMAEQEGLDTSDDIVRLPKDLKRRHDELVERIGKRSDAERREKKKEKYDRLDEMIRERLPEIERYRWQDDSYKITPAGSCEELMTEGRILHHCVGSSDTYMERMAQGESWILFLRRKEEAEKPYYTIEIDLKTDVIRQYYSAYDRQPDKERIETELRKFKNSIRKEKMLQAG